MQETSLGLLPGLSLKKNNKAKNPKTEVLEADQDGKEWLFLCLEME